MDPSSPIFGQSHLEARHLLALTSSLREYVCSIFPIFEFYSQSEIGPRVLPECSSQFEQRDLERCHLIMIQVFISSTLTQLDFVHKSELRIDTGANFSAWGARILSPSTSIIDSFRIQEGALKMGHCACFCQTLTVDTGS